MRFLVYLGIPIVCLGLSWTYHWATGLPFEWGDALKSVAPAIALLLLGNRISRPSRAPQWLRRVAWGLGAVWFGGASLYSLWRAASGFATNTVVLDLHETTATRAGNVTGYIVALLVYSLAGLLMGAMAALSAWLAIDSKSTRSGYD